MAKFQPSERAIQVGKPLLLLLGFAVFILLLAAFLWVSSENESVERRNSELSGDRARLTERRDDLEQRNTALVRQILELGEAPTVDPAPPDDDPVPELVPVPGPSCIDEMGLQPCRGPKGEPGSDGRPGVPGDDATGRAGEDGADGRQGPVGPAGPQGDPGVQGETGDQGPKGDTGDQGPAGPPGTAQPGTYACPDGQYVAGFTIGPAGSVTLHCRQLPTLPGTPPQ